MAIFPASHYVVGKEDLERAVKAIEKELEEQIKYFKSEGKLLEGTANIRTDKLRY